MPGTKKVAETPTATRINSNMEDFIIVNRNMAIEDLTKAVNRLADVIEKKRRLF